MAWTRGERPIFRFSSICMDSREEHIAQLNNDVRCGVAGLLFRPNTYHVHIQPYRSSDEPYPDCGKSNPLGFGAITKMKRLCGQFDISGDPIRMN